MENIGNNHDQKDVFISYRRKGGATVARLLCEVLNNRNITTFFDKESLGEGDFDTSIENHLSNARNFILIVTPELFNRGFDAETNIYIESETANDWVYKEIKIALDTGKTIIPIFVNDVSQFPAILPPGIEQIARKDALTFGHDHFDSEMRKLIDRIKTRKDQLIEQYLEATDKDPKILLETCLQIAGDNRQNQVIKILQDKIRQFSNDSHQDINTVIDAMFSGSSVAFQKDLCKNLALDDRGDSGRIKSNLSGWISNKEYSVYSDELSENDRFEKLINIFGTYYRSHEDRENALELADYFKIEIERKRSSDDVYSQIFYGIGIEAFFYNYPGRFPAEDLKDIAFNLVGEYIFENFSPRKKEDLKDFIISYVNYETDCEEKIESQYNDQEEEVSE